MVKFDEPVEKKPLNKPLPGTTAKPPATPHAKPRAEGESDESYNKRTANFAKSQERLKEFGLSKSPMNKDVYNSKMDAFKEKYGHDPSGYKRAEPDKKPPVKPDMSAENPSAKKEPKLPSQFNKNAANQKAPNPKSKVQSIKKDIVKDAAEKKMSVAPRIGRKMRRMKRKLVAKKPIAGGKY